MDQAFLPRHYESRPRQMFYHSILALEDVVQDGVSQCLFPPAVP